MLVGLTDMNSPALLKPTRQEDAEFVQTWWKQILPLLCSLDRYHPMLANTPLAPPVAWPEPPVLPPEGEPVNLTDMESQTQAQWAEQCRAEEAETLAAAAAFDDNGNRNYARQWDDWALQDELGKASGPPRHRLTLTLSTPGTSSTSSSLTIPVPAANQPVALHLQVRVDTTESRPGTGVDHDEVKLMQTGVPNNLAAVPTLDALPNDIQSATFNILRRRARQRWAALQELIQATTSSSSSSSTTSSMEQAATMLADMVEPLLCTTAEPVAGPESYLDVEDIPTPVLQLPLQGAHGAEGVGAEITADFVDEALNKIIDDLDYEHRFHGLRFVVSTIVQTVRGNVAQLRVALALLSRKLPQPNLREQDRHIAPATQARLRRLLHELLEQLREHAPEWPSNSPIDELNVVPYCGPASEMAIDVMQFLETGEYDVESAESTSGEAGNDNRTTICKQYALHGCPPILLLRRGAPCYLVTLQKADVDVLLIQNLQPMNRPCAPFTRTLRVKTPPPTALVLVNLPPRLPLHQKSGRRHPNQIHYNDRCATTSATSKGLSTESPPCSNEHFSDSSAKAENRCDKKCKQTKKM